MPEEVIRYARARTLQRAGGFSTAMEQFRRLLRGSPGDLQLNLRYAECLRGGAGASLAVEHLEARCHRRVGQIGGVGDDLLEGREPGDVAPRDAHHLAQPALAQRAHQRGLVLDARDQLAQRLVEVRTGLRAEGAPEVFVELGLPGPAGETDVVLPCRMTYFTLRDDDVAIGLAFAAPGDSTAGALEQYVVHHVAPAGKLPGIDGIEVRELLDESDWVAPRAH